MTLTSGAKPGTSIVVKGGQRKQVSVAEEFKMQGNSYFVSLEYPNAIECYTRCLGALDDPNLSASVNDKSELQKLVLSNRA